MPAVFDASSPRPSPLYASDAELGYARSRWQHTAGSPRRFDKAYRVAQLPLVAPEHPAAIHEVPGLPYRSGRCERTIRPACTVMQVARFIDPSWLVELEADAVIGAALTSSA